MIGETVKIGYFPQDLMEVLDPKLTVIDWLTTRCSKKGFIETELRSVMGQMLFKGNDTEKPISVLSGGERARLVIAELLLMGYNVLVLDEPTNHLDLESIESLNLALSKFKTTLIFVSHDREFINSLANRIFHIKDNKIINYPGNYDDYQKTIK